MYFELIVAICLLAVGRLRMEAGTGGGLLGLAFVFLQNDKPFQFSPMCQAETQPHNQQQLRIHSQHRERIHPNTHLHTCYFFIQFFMFSERSFFRGQRVKEDLLLLP